MNYDILYFHELTSTNDYAWEHVKEFSSENITIIQAGHQTNGRGQGSHQWFSEKDKNLLFTLCIPANTQINFPLFSLHHMVSLSVREYVKNTLSEFDVKIKWPNDIMVNDKKIAGILIENIYSGNVLQWVFTGIGININQTDFPTEIQQKATSICLLVHRTLSIHEEINTFMNTFDKYYDLWLRKEFRLLHGNYEKQLWKKGEKISLRLKENEKLQRGLLTGVSPEGKILLKDEHDKILSFHHHEVEWIF